MTCFFNLEQNEQNYHLVSTCDNIDRFCDTANAPSAMPPNLHYMGDDTTLYYDSYDMKSDDGWEELVNLIKVRKRW